jgi:two-component system chemotaxis response regulator CheB
MVKKNIVVIGASAGGFDAIKKLICMLPAELQASIFIVWHMSPDVTGVLPQVLNRCGGMIAVNARDGETIELNRVYVAPPDHHMVIEDETIRVTNGPKENRFRPAVDPLFRSAAVAYRTRVVGIVLSGALDDGTAGLWAIKRFGGTAIVQHPAEAEVSSMPQNAIDAVDVDHIATIEQIGKLIVELSGNEVPIEQDLPQNENDKTQLEIDIAMDKVNSKIKFFKEGELSPYTCPECHGVLSEIQEGSRLRFRCHTGHAFSSESLLHSLSDNIETNIWTSLRSTQEGIFLLNALGDHFADLNQPKVAAKYFRKAKEANEVAQQLRNVLKDRHPLYSHLPDDEVQEKIG